MGFIRVRFTSGIENLHHLRDRWSDLPSVEALRFGVVPSVVTAKYSENTCGDEYKSVVTQEQIQNTVVCVRQNIEQRQCLK